ncbi:MAG TPA: phosphoglucosamine mutase [Blastocatellia bacterium]|nr:phosphoglucosamine mutase [Blastocatellia bacterium]
MSNKESKKFFGTDGVRGVAGEFPLDRRTVSLIGKSLTANLTRASGSKPRIIIGRDTRESGPQIEQWLAEGASAAGAEVESAGVITTPGVAFITRKAGFDAGVVISASHNPYRDNGIKIFSPSGKKLDDRTEISIEKDLQAWIDEESVALNQGRVPADEHAEYKEDYIGYLANEVGNGLRLDGLNVAIDCANGAASAIAPEVFRRLGTAVTLLSASPDGRNINEQCGSLHMENLQEAVLAQKLDLGIAFDGDADRALFVDGSGALIDGDHVLLILAEHMKSKGALAKQTVVATVMSNIGLEIALQERAIELVRAQVGDRYVLEELLARGASVGGEQSGHIIFPSISLAGDGIITAIELLRAVRESRQTLTALASKLTKFPQVLINVRVASKPPLETLPEVQSEVDRIEEALKGRGRLLVRYSGTENLARVMIEGEDQAKIEEQARGLAGLIQRVIG